MPSTTPAQQRLMGQAYAIKTGKMKPSDLDPEYKDQIMKLADSMSTKDLKDFAETKHSEMKKENMNEDFLPMFEDFTTEESIDEGAFFRLPYKKVANDFFIAKKNLDMIYEAVKRGDDFDVKYFDDTMKILEGIRKEAKKFTDPNKIKGTPYQ